MAPCLSRTALNLGIGAVGTLAGIATLAQLRRLWWQHKRRAGKRDAPELKDDVDVLRVGYSLRKLPSEIDHIVIGSGLSGLYLAALLSKLGRRVLVLEQHYVAGGCTHTFKDKGFEFDTGVHYVGQATQLTALMDFAAGRQGAFKMQRSGIEDGSNVYNEIQVGDGMYRFRPGKEKFIADLVEHFPREEAAIRRFFNEVFWGVTAMGLVGSKQFMPSKSWTKLLQIPGPCRWLSRRYMERTLSKVLEDCGIEDSRLKAVLSAEFGDYATVPDEAPFFLHAVILFHYIWEGGFYPVGGSDAFAHALVPQIFEAGGSVLVRAPVSRIVMENGRAVGVEVKGKDIIQAKRSVISATGVEVTYRKLLDEVDVQKMGGVPQSLLRTEKKGSGHHIYAFVGLEGTSKELGLPTHNIWSFPSAGNAATPDLTSAWLDVATIGRKSAPSFLASDAEAASKLDLPCFMSFPSAKDAEYNSRCPGKSTAVILTEGRAEYFGQPGTHGKRGDDYESVKNRYKQPLLNCLFRHFPHLKSKVEYVDIGTPWSNEHYLGHPGSYGLDQDVNRFLDPSLNVVPNNVRGLYLTGQDFLSCGVFAQPIVALFTLTRMLGWTSVDFWILAGDLLFSVFRRSIFAPGATHPGLRDLFGWIPL
eukprot:TRINITY_DN59223_c0_g1_i1.p1 TRINITY_DN59223_c0_g1~~TRINITY_DN59223_c0_g1_i1.p1  ORF type:complete len:643 (-),score=93.16 TRINITY_DN59223_c0_g1_i1:386-2314(-)